MLEERCQWDPALEERAATHLLNFPVGEFLESHSWCVVGGVGKSLVVLFRSGYQLTTGPNASDWLDCD